MVVVVCGTVLVVWCTVDVGGAGGAEVVTGAAVVVGAAAAVVAVAEVVVVVLVFLCFLCFLCFLWLVVEDVVLVVAAAWVELVLDFELEPQPASTTAAARIVSSTRFIWPGLLLWVEDFGSEYKPLRSRNVAPTRRIPRTDAPASVEGTTASDGRTVRARSRDPPRTLLPRRGSVESARPAGCAVLA